ncbi:MAG: DivIVA domain-containing protein [Ilumatobacteraceae bacterium]
METPSTIVNTTFKIVKKGYDPDEVRAYLREVAGTLQTAQDHAGSVETRARQAIAKAQEAAQQAQARAAAASAQVPASSDANPDTISRALVLAQKTADDTVRAAEQEAEALRSTARREADEAVHAARSEAAALAEGARSEARKAGEAERVRVEAELQQLMARLEFLRDDVAQMEAHAAHHRDRLVVVAAELQTLATRPTGGLGEARRPVLSAAADLGVDGVVATDVGSLADPTGEQVTPAADGDDQVGGGDAARDDTGQLPGGDPDATRALTVVDASGQPTGPSAPTPAGDTGDTRDTDVTAEVPIVE